MHIHVHAHMHAHAHIHKLSLTELISMYIYSILYLLYNIYLYSGCTALYSTYTYLFTWMWSRIHRWMAKRLIEMTHGKVFRELQNGMRTLNMS